MRAEDHTSNNGQGRRGSECLQMKLYRRVTALIKLFYRDAETERLRLEINDLPEHTEVCHRRSAPKVLNIKGFSTQKVLMALVSSTIIDAVFGGLSLNLSP